MTILHLYDSELEAYNSFRRVVYENYEDIIVISSPDNLIVTKDGNTHVFLGEYFYSMWCKGKDYILNGVLMSDGYPIKKLKGGSDDNG